ncbi:hypothetical protein OH77DRAFT_1057351 [Trametes cingulata]|nr:hypothetical protein OH77DRAFT_1057351 [Trametes cingulata]
MAPDMTTTVIASSSTVILSRPSPTITSCQSRCREQANSATGCQSLGCICGGTDWLNKGLVCTVANCSAHEASGFLDQFNVLCGLASDLPDGIVTPTIPGTPLRTGTPLPGAATPTTTFALPGTALADSAAELPGDALSISHVHGSTSSTSTSPASTTVAPASSSSSSRGPSTAVIAGLSVALVVVALAAAFACFYVWRRLRRDRAFYLNRKNASDLVPFDDDDREAGGAGKEASEIVHARGPVPVTVGGVLSVGSVPLPVSRGVTEIPPSKGVRPATVVPDARSTVAEDGSVLQSGARSPDGVTSGGAPRLPTTSVRKAAVEPSATSRRAGPLGVSGAPALDAQATHSADRSDGGQNPPERVLVVPWSLGQRLLAMAGGTSPTGNGNGTGGHGSRGRDVDSEPPPAYEPHRRQGHETSAGGESEAL